MLHTSTSELLNAKEAGLAYVPPVQENSTYQGNVPYGTNNRGRITPHANTHIWFTLALNSMHMCMHVYKATVLYCCFPTQLIACKVLFYVPRKRISHWLCTTVHRKPNFRSPLEDPSVANSIGYTSIWSPLYVNRSKPKWS